MACAEDTWGQKERRPAHLCQMASASNLFPPQRAALRVLHNVPESGVDARLACGPLLDLVQVVLLEESWTADADHKVGDLSLERTTP